MSVIVITGGSRGIGASTAEHIARRGMGVILTYNTDPLAANTIVERIERVGGKAVALKLDVSDVGSFEAFRTSVVLTLRDTWNATMLSGLVNNAGYGLFNSMATVTEAQFDGLFNVHLKGPFFLTQTLLPLFAENASIVNLTSATTRVATAGVAPYAAFKGGARGAHPLHGQRIRRAAHTGQRGITRRHPHRVGRGLNAEFEAKLAAQTALGRVGEPEDVARVIAMLLSEEGAWINAQTLEVAGGYNI